MVYLYFTKYGTFNYIDEVLSYYYKVLSMTIKYGSYIDEEPSYYYTIM